MSCAFNASVSNLDVTFTNTTSPNGAGYPNFETYTWYFGDGSSYDTDYNSPNASHSYAVPGFYQVSLVGRSLIGGVPASYCSAAKTVAVGGATVNQPPVARFRATLSKQYADGSQWWSFNGSLSTDPDGTVAGYSFNFGDGSYYDGPSAYPGHTFAAGGSYVVTLQVYDNKGALSGVASTTINTPGGSLA